MTKKMTKKKETDLTDLTDTTVELSKAETRFLFTFVDKQRAAGTIIEYGEEMLSTARKLIWKHLFEIKPELKDYHCNYNATDGIVDVITKKRSKK